MFLLSYSLLRRAPSPEPGPLIDPEKLSVLVPVRDEDAVLAGLFPGLDGSGAEKIVVDGSSNGSPSRILDLCPGCLVIREREPRGKPAALNLGLSSATRRYVCVMDADCRPPPGFLEALPAPRGSPAVQYAIDPLATGSPVSYFAETEERAWFSMAVAARSKIGLFVPLAGSAMLIDRKLLEELGGWDEDSLTEDMEISLRMLERGVSVEYRDDVRCSKLVPGSLKALVVQRLRWYRGYLDLLPRGLKQLFRRPSLKSLDAVIQLSYPLAMSAGLLVGAAVSLGVLLGFYTPTAVATASLALTGALILLVSLASRGETGKRFMVLAFMWEYWAFLSLIALAALAGKIAGVSVKWVKTPRDGSA